MPKLGGKYIILGPVVCTDLSRNFWSNTSKSCNRENKI